MFDDCVPRISFIDASTDAYEEEGDYEEEEEENFDHCTNQGKLTPMQAILMQANTSANSTSASYTLARHHCNLFI